ncbi:MAG: Hpt domain-containing protein [Gemmatimonadetes bacterium]|nr:Hpt domain-containing protein [Gemmatimonadota bacterium]
MPVEANQIIDESILDSYRTLQEDGKPDVVTEFIDVFLEDLPGRLTRLEQSVAGDNASEIRSAAHALKGSSGSVGAALLSSVCGQLEAMARTGRVEGARDLHTRILAEAVRATEELTKLRRP